MKVPVLETINSSYTQEVFSSSSIDESSIDFKFEMDRNIYLDTRDTHISLKLQLFKGRVFDVFKRAKADLKTKTEDESDKKPELHLTLINYTLPFSVVKFILTKQWFATPVLYVLIEHKQCELLGSEY